MRAVGGTAARKGEDMHEHGGRRSGAGLPGFELAVLALGFGLCHAWVVGFLGFAGRYDLGADGPFGYDQVYLFAGAAAAIVAACLSSRVFGKRARGGNPECSAVCDAQVADEQGERAGLAHKPGHRASFAVVNLAVLGIALALLGVAVAVGTKALLVAAFAMFGISSAFLQMAWGARFALFGMRMALLSVPLGAMVTAVIMMLLPDAALLSCLYVLPLLSLLLLCSHRAGDSIVLSLSAGAAPCGEGDPAPASVPRADDSAFSAGISPRTRGPVNGPSSTAARSVSQGPTGSSPAPSPVSPGTFVRLMASIAVFSLVGRCLDSFPAASVDAGVPAFVADNYAFLAILAVGILLVVFALVFGERFDVMLVYRLSLPCMVAGFAVLTMFMDRFTVVSVAVVTVGYEFFDLLFWALLVGLVRQAPAPRPLFVFGWGVALTYAGMGAGTLDMSALALMCILVLVVLVVLVLPEGVLSKVGFAPRPHDDGRPAEEQPVTLESRCAAVAARCDLTPRECDVLLLLARGRTLSVVARELNIAEGTARTHMMHIYSKLDVHKQQELIDLVEGEGK